MKKVDMKIIKEIKCKACKFGIEFPKTYYCKNKKASTWMFYAFLLEDKLSKASECDYWRIQEVPN